MENGAETLQLQKNDDADHVEDSAETLHLQINDDAIHSKNEAVPLGENVEAVVLENGPNGNFQSNEFIDFPDTLDLGRCEDKDSLDISGFNVDVDPETSGQQVERETGFDHSDSSNESSDQSSELSNEEHEMDESINNSNRTFLNNKPKGPFLKAG